MGVKAAVRVLGIVTVGSDVEPIGDMRNRAPSEIETRIPLKFRVSKDP